MARESATQDEVSRLIAGGLAQPLLPDGVPGPVRIKNTWWHVLQGSETYQPVTDAAATAQYEHDLSRLSAAYAAIAATSSAEDPDSLHGSDIAVDDAAGARPGGAESGGATDPAKERG